jgi:hypothetical protein
MLLSIASVPIELLFSFPVLVFLSVEPETEATLNYISGEQDQDTNEQGKRTFTP